MKTTLKTIAALLLLTPTAVKAQTTSNRILPRVGIKAGLNASNFYTDDVTDKNMMSGFNVGIFMKAPLTKHLSLMPELYYTTKGAELTYNNSVISGTGRFRLNYLEVPILLGINVFRNINVHAGPYVSYLLDGSAKGTSNVSLFDFQKNINVDNYNRMEGGLALGAAIDIAKLSVGARYYYGMTDIGRSQQFNGVTYTVPNARNSVFNIYLALALN